MANFFVKSNEWGTSSYALVTANTAYSAGAIRRANTATQGQAFVYCVTGGTTGASATLTEGADVTADFTNGSTTWRLCTGFTGYVADAWRIAAPSVTSLAIASTSGASSSGTTNYTGFLYSNVGVGNTLYVDSAYSSSVNELGYDALVKQFRATVMYIAGTEPNATYRVPAPRTPLKLVSADSSVAAASAGAYKRGATYTATAASLNRIANGPVQFYGFNFLVTDARLTFESESSPSGQDHNTSTDVHLYSDCVFTVVDNGNFSAQPGLVFGMCSTGQEVGQSLTEVHASTFNLDHPFSTVAVNGEAMFDGVTFTTTLPTFPVAGIFPVCPVYDQFNVYALLYGSALGTYDSYSAGFQKVRLRGCTFDKPVVSLFTSMATRPSEWVFDGCEFTSSDFESMLKSISPTSIGVLKAHFIGSGVAGALDPSSYEYHTPRLLARKVNGVYRDGSLPDVYGNYHSHYVKSRSAGLEPYWVPEELPHITAQAMPGTYEVCLYLAVPPGQLLDTASFMAQFIGPDFGDAAWATETARGVTEKVANTVFVRQPEPDAEPSEYPVVTMGWTGKPGDWVTQKVSAIMTSDHQGKFYCVPFLARVSTELIICPTLELRKVA